MDKCVHVLRKGVSHGIVTTLSLLFLIKSQPSNWFQDEVRQAHMKVMELQVRLYFHLCEETLGKLTKLGRSVRILPEIM